MAMFKKNKNKKQETLPNEKYDYNRRESLVDFNKYDEAWERELRRLSEKNKRTEDNINNGSLRYRNYLPNHEFERIVRSQEQYKVNDYNYNNNSELFLDNVKYQIFLETQRLLSGSKTFDTNLENTILPENYRTGDDYEDNMIRIAGYDDPTLYQVLREKFEDNKMNPYARGKDVNSLTKQDQIYDSSSQLYRRSRIDDLNSEKIKELSDSDREKIKSYSSYTNSNSIHTTSDSNKNYNQSSSLDKSPEKTNTVQQSPIIDQKNDNEWKKYRQDIIDYVDAKNVNEPINFVPPPPPIEPPKAEDIVVHSYRTEPKPENNEIDDSFLVKTDDLSRPSLKPVVPMVAANDRVSNVKDLNDTEWQKIKNYIKDFNTNDDSVSIANTSSIVDADDALKVDLNAKFYLTPDQLKEIRNKQLNQFQSVINDYEDTLKQQEKRNLQRAYDEMNSKIKTSNSTNDKLKEKIEEQNKQNLKVIDENIKLKKQIKELEEKLSKESKKPVITMVDLEPEKKVTTLYPDKNELAQAQLKLKEAEQDKKELKQDKLTSDDKKEEINIFNNVDNKNESPIDSMNVSKNNINNDKIINQQTYIINENHYHIKNNDENELLREELEPNTIAPKSNIKLIKPKNAIPPRRYNSLQNITHKEPETVDILDSNKNFMNDNPDQDEISASIINPQNIKGMPNNLNKNKANSIYTNTLAKNRAAALGSSNSYAPYNDMIRSTNGLSLNPYRNNNEGMPIVNQDNKVVSIKEAYAKK